MRSTWSFFIGAAILIVGLLLKAGAPAESILGGALLAALVTWKGVGRLGLSARRAGN